MSWLDSMFLSELRDSNYFRLYKIVQALEGVKVENFKLTLFTSITTFSSMLNMKIDNSKDKKVMIFILFFYHFLHHRRVPYVMQSDMAKGAMAKISFEIFLKKYSLIADPGDPT